MWSGHYQSGTHRLSRPVTAPSPSKETGPAAFSTGTYNRTVSSQALPLHGVRPLPREAVLNAGNVDRALESIEAEVAGMARDVAIDDEVTSAKRYLVGSIPRSLETHAGIARFLQTTEQFGLRLDHDRTLPGLVDAVTGEAVADAARRTLRPEQAAIVIAGPYEES